MYKYIIILILLLSVSCTTGIRRTPETPIILNKVPITFINENPGVTQLGLVKFVLNSHGEKVDYIVLNMVWDNKIHVIDLEPGVYGVTQYVPKGQVIVGYQTFEVKNEPQIVKFEKLL